MSADPKLREILQSRWRAQRAGPFFEARPIADEVTKLLPREYLSLVTTFGGMEGFLGATYLRLYRIEEVITANQAYEVPALFPACFVFGSNGGGEAFGFLIETGQVLKVPFIPLSKDYAENLAPSFSEFLRQLDASGVSGEANPNTGGMEIHEINPIVFGGSPTDEKNKALVPPAKHAELARFWNKMYRNVRQGQ